MSAPLALPPRLTMAGMFAELSRIIQDDNGAFASGGIYWWGDLRISPTVRSDPLPGVITSEQHASHYVYIALALVMGFGRSNMSEEQTMDAYFSRARDLLGDPLERVEWSKDDMSTLSLMAFYYIERNQLEEAYSYVGMALR
ncbi:hypothetical protein HBH98_252650 [Parastagonospora nodorum]|nr:hypothetical protein HBH53_259260 [Parastagonospora nodorum]KAH3956033.1 hypothetical protein HBH51_257680 [Parastagonospora nodorum]KAH4215362.1 hypothetical protein HBI06_255070 [Parastagonospora nodorum]KAH4223037.1 hypothetical protein HBI05_252300 [Parastagonospora nodorum]KAH4332788.1 hypothetical protein HBH98_252650 [Parastagonospora nodorum]